MAHIQTNHLRLWKPQDLVVDKISSQKVFVDNIDALEEFAISTLKKSAIPVASIADLRAIDTSDTVIYNDGTTVMVKSHGLYFFDRSNNDIDNESTIIAPTTGGGRWVSISTFFGSLALRDFLTKTDIGLGKVPNVTTNDQTPTYDHATTLSPIISGEKLSVAFGKIAKAIVDLINHLANRSNPHNITATQVGLGNVPNVTTNDQTPIYGESSTLSTLTSGEKLSIAFGKIARAIADLINHLANKSNPHGVTKTQIGLGNVDNTSDLNKPLSTAVKAELTKINGRLLTSVKAVNDLRAINTSDTTIFKDGTLIMVQELGLFTFNRNAIGGNGADGNAIIAPITGGGGWVPTTPTDIPLSGREASTAAELDTILTNALMNMASNSIKYTIINCVQPFEPFGGGIIHMTIYKTNNAYAVIEARVYYSTPNIALQFTRSRYSNTWGSWHRLPYLDTDGKIPLSQLPSGIVPASIE